MRGYGRFFHCIKSGDAAKKALEKERDEFYKDFISLTYEYSAKETLAAKGYILHDVHTDDVPIEWRVETSFEYKDTGEANSLEHQDTGTIAGGGIVDPAPVEPEEPEESEDPDEWEDLEDAEDLDGTGEEIEAAKAVESEEDAAEAEGSSTSTESGEAVEIAIKASSIPLAVPARNAGTEKYAADTAGVGETAVPSEAFKETSFLRNRQGCCS